MSIVRRGWNGVFLIGLGLIGWAICGATIGIGRSRMSMTATLLVHAVVAPAVFALLTGVYFKVLPVSSPASTAFVFLAVVMVMDAVVVAPILERSYAMFASVLGTWIPFASIFGSTYAVGRASRQLRASNVNHPAGGLKSRFK